MTSMAAAAPPCVGIIANPVSARDIRRIVANAGNLQIAERVNIVMRLLTTLHGTGVQRVLMMPDKAGIRAMLTRNLKRENNLHHSFPALEFLDMDPTSTVEDTFLAARMMRAAGVRAIIVLGGDGTHRAVVRECSDIPIAGLSTGTNNAFPEMREPTITGLAAGLFAAGRIAPAEALAPNKLLEVLIHPRDGGPQRRDIAIVDAVITHDRSVGARALWKTGSLAAAYLAFAEPEAIGLSSIGGLLQPVSRRERGGLAVQLSSDPAHTLLTLHAPIAPGLVLPVPVASWHRLVPDEPVTVQQQAGTVALDGERELAFEAGDRVTVTLRENAFFTVDVARCMAAAARDALLRRPATGPALSNP